ERDERQHDVVHHSTTRGKVLWEGWVDRACRWEIDPLRDLALLLLDGHLPHDGATLANRVQQPMRALGRFGECQSLLRRAVAIDEKAYEPDHPTLARDYSN